MRLTATCLVACLAIGMPLFALADSCARWEDSWSHDERQWWTETLCVGRELSFCRTGTCAPAGQSLVRAAYLETLLHENPYRDVIRQVGLRITGAVVETRVDLSRSTVDRSLWLESCQFKDDVILSNLRADRGVSLDGSIFQGNLQLSGSRINGNLYLRNVAVDGAMIMFGARIADNVFVSAAKDSGNRIVAFLAGSLRIGGDLVLSQQTNFASGPRIGRVLLTGARIEGRIRVSDETHIEDFRLDHARIGSGLSIEGSTVERLNLSLSEIGGDLGIWGGTMGSRRTSGRSTLDLTSTSIAGALRFGDEHEHATRWRDTPRLIHASAGQIDLNDPWPKGVDLAGFRFGYFHPLETRPLEDWIEGSAHPVPDLYERAADLFADLGNHEAAEEMRKAALDRRFTNSTYLYWLLSRLYKYLFDYGYNPVGALIAALFVVGLGWAVLSVSGEATAHRDEKGRIGFWFSLDLFLPFVQLRKAHYEVVLMPGVQKYFYLHKLVGYLLATLVVAAITGIIK